MNALGGLANGCIERFETDEQKRNMYRELSKMVIFVFVLLVISFFGKLLWNEFLAGAGSSKGFFTFVKPLPTMFHAIAVYVTIMLFFR